MSLFLRQWTIWVLVSSAIFSNSTFAKKRLVGSVYSSYIDVVFAIDESGSTLAGEYGRISAEFSQYVNRFYEGGHTQTRFAVIACLSQQFSSPYTGEFEPHIRLNWGATIDQNEIVRQIATRYAYTSNMFDNFLNCFDRIKTNIFKSRNDRPNAPNVLIGNMFFTCLYKYAN